jgi:predicted transcriptional regulator
MSVPMSDPGPRAPARDGSQQFRRAEIVFREANVPARFQVLLALAEGERDIGAMCGETAQTCPAPEPHVAILRRLRLGDACGQDRQRSYRLTVLGGQLVATIDALLE